MIRPLNLRARWSSSKFGSLKVIAGFWKEYLCLTVDELDSERVAMNRQAIAAPEDITNDSELRETDIWD